MPIGPEPTRLSARLRQKLEDTTHEQDDLIKSALENFASDISTILTAARTTIEDDTRGWAQNCNQTLSDHSKALSTRLRVIDRLAVMSPLMWLASLAAGICAVAMLSAWWANDTIKAQSAILHMMVQQDGPNLMVAFDRQRSEIIPCGPKFRCLLVKE